MTNRKHPHAELMAEYAKDAMETDRPWERWEYWSLTSDEWRAHSSHPTWVKGTWYRRKPRTIRIGEYDVPEPVREELEIGQTYYTPCMASDMLFFYDTWDGYFQDYRHLKRGLIHLDRESAELHARALISLTEQPNDRA